VELWNFAVVEFDLIHEVVFGVSGYTAGVVEVDVDDFSGSTVEVGIGACFFVEYEFDSVSFPVCG